MKKILAVVMAAVCAVMVTGCVSQGDYDALSAKHDVLIEKYDELKAENDELKAKSDDYADQLEDALKENLEYRQAELDKSLEKGSMSLSVIGSALGENVTYILTGEGGVIYFIPLDEKPTVANVKAAYQAVSKGISNAAWVHGSSGCENFYFRCMTMDHDLVFEIKVDFTSEEPDMNYSYGFDYIDIVTEAAAEFNASK